METTVDRSIELEGELKSASRDCEKRSLILEHIKKQEVLNWCVPDFSQGLEWINTTKNLSFGDQLKGKICVLDFFTYCCINCMHILPDLHAIEEKFTDIGGVVVIGVHSAKFENEKTSANILSAVLRYNIEHPVVNDHQATMWNQLGIMCWPTVVIVGPSGQILLSLAGEGHRQTMLDFVTIAADYYMSQNAIQFHAVGISPIKSSLPSSPLLFPGKVCLDDSGEKLIVSDTGHHRVLVVNMEGVVEECIGSGEHGSRDGSFDEAQFNSPQGVCYKTGGVVYVADTENHAIREIDLNRKIVVTVTGTGSQGNDLEGGKVETEQEISSPWDVALCPSLGSNDSDVLLIAMAGTHQIWTLFLKDATWIKNNYSQRTCIRWAGSGQEQNRNNSYPHKAAFAQPSGVTIDHSRQMVYIADSESSSIRSLSLKDGAVKAVVGGERDPMNLFAYGDVDGKGVDAKLQHPLAVTLLSEETGEVIVADSYNHKLKVVNPSTKLCSTVMGIGRAGNVCGRLEGAELNEPGGLCMDRTRDVLYIADTNNHAIKVYKRKEGTVAELSVILPSKNKDTTDYQAAPTRRSIAGRSPAVIREESLTVAVNSTLDVQLELSLYDGAHLTEGAPSAWQIFVEDGDIGLMTSGTVAGKLGDLEDQPRVILTIPEGMSEKKMCVRLECMLYFCSPDGVCKMKGVVFVQNLSVENTKTSSNTCIVMQHKLS